MMGEQKMGRYEIWRKAMKGLALPAVVVLSLVGSACTPDFATDNQSDVVLLLTSIEAVAGAGPDKDEDSAFLLSDVLTGGGVINDNAKVTVRAELKNQNSPSAGAFNDVVLERYDVRFTRTDGHNVEGLDVPYGFSGPLALRVAPGGESEAAFVLVRHEAKLEPPLSNMVNLGGLGILQCIANITLHGRTGTGKAVEVSGRLEVTFTDFADSDAPPPAEEQ